MVENDMLLQRIASRLARSGFRLPALVALEVGRPLAFVLGQCLWVAQPALALLLPRDQISQIAHLLEEPAAVDALIAHLEAQ